MVPSTWGLLEAINGLTEFAYEVRGVLINKSKRLRHKDIIGHCTLQKCIIDIRLIKRLTSTCRKTENEAYRGGLGNHTKGVVIVYARTLMKTFCNKKSFILVNRAIR